MGSRDVRSVYNGIFRDTFRIWLKKPYNAVQTGKGFNRVKALKLDVDVRSPAVARRDPEFQQGIACGRFSDGYLLVITPGSGSALIRHQHNEAEETIATAFPPNAIKKPPQVNHLRAVCSTRNDTTSVGLWVNGKRVAHAIDPDGPSSFDQFPFMERTATHQLLLSSTT